MQALFCFCFMWPLHLHVKCYTEWTKVTPLSMQLPKAATRLRSFKNHKTQLDIAGKSSAFSFLLNQQLHASCASPGNLNLVATFSELSLGCSDCRVERKRFFISNLVTWRERERWGGGGGSETEQNLPLAWTSFSVAFPTIYMQRRDKRDVNVSRSASQRRVTMRLVAYRPAVSIRLNGSLGFPMCLFLAGPLSSAGDT